MRIGIDAGGTFTDFVVLDPKGRLSTFKLRSNPRDPAAVILAGIQQAITQSDTPIEDAAVDVVHGSTVATNALLERKGARTAFLTTAGFEDLLTIGRQNRRDLYRLSPRPRARLVPPDLCFGIAERQFADGSVGQVPKPAAIRKLASQLKAAGVESIAISFLHAYHSGEHERIVQEALGSGFYISASHDICPEFREYERSSTTAINAYVGPLMDRYLGRLAATSPYPVSIMQSSGGIITAAEASRQAVRTILSGPAGGVVGALAIAKQAGFPRVLAFDMGGTSTDVSLCDGQAAETTEAEVDGMPVRVPMLDIHTVGAGGGSIARIDEGGLLRVGPQSAGADPGPACYGTGTLPTVTDAHVVLGRMDALLGGAMPLDRARSEKALATLGMDPVQAAEGVIRVANANMLRAIRAVSIERGHDPRDYALLAFGGGGGLHACEMAEDLGITTVIVPEQAGVLSAYGMLAADQLRDYAQGVLGTNDLDAVFTQLTQQAEGHGKLERYADLRYLGQSYELTVPWNSQSSAQRAFEKLHERLYGYRMTTGIEVVTLRVRSRIRAKPWRTLPAKPLSGKGPKVLASYGSTTLVPAGWRYSRDPFGNLILTR
ncbi:MAG: hydantoinase/oxoprolinase family protein [Acidobacteria bacterium]|nr:hydantoinase/oxoprolinase family protein [Acidobacteriota bacterium]